MTTVRSSSTDRALLCPGSIKLCAIVPQRESSEEANDGVYLHYLIAKRAIEELGATPPEGGLVEPKMPAGYRLNPFSKWVVDYAIRHIQETIPADWSLMVEVEMEAEFPRWKNTGHGDIIGLSPDVTEMKGIDWKTGRDPVDPADNNDQVLSYIVQAKVNWPTLTKASFDIVQPLVDESEGHQRVSSVMIEGDVLNAAVLSLDLRMMDALDHPMDLNTGRRQCRYCAAKLSCPAYIADKDNMKLTMTESQLAAIKATPDDALIAQWVMDGKLLSPGFEEAEKIAKERIAAVGSLVAPNGAVMTVKQTAGSYSVVDPIGLWKSVEETIPDPDKRALCFKPSVTAIQDAIAETHGVPKTGKMGLTAKSIFQAKQMPFMKQGIKEQIVISI